MIHFDRFQNSVLNLAQFPNVRSVSVDNQSPYDKMTLCEHIRLNASSIRLVIGYQQAVCEVVGISLQEP